MTDTTTYPYPQDKVTITATYRPPKTDGPVLVYHPETVQIELNDDVVPADPAERLAFLTELINSLFRDELFAHPDLVVDPDMGVPACTGAGLEVTA